MPLVIPVSCLRFSSGFATSILLTVQANLLRSSSWDITAMNLMAFFNTVFYFCFLHLMLCYYEVNSVVIIDASS